MKNARQMIRGYLAKHLRNMVISDDYHIFRSGYFNSLFAMQLVVFLEKEFELRLEGEDLQLSNFESINAIVELVERKSSNKAQSAEPTIHTDGAA